MGTRIQNVAEVTFNIQTPAFTSDAFGIPLILTECKWADYGSDLVRSFTDAADVATDVLTGATSQAYYAALSLKAQTSKGGKKVPLFKVGRKQSNSNAKWNFTWNEDATAGTFTLTVSKAGGATQTTAAIAFGAAAADVKAALELLTNVGEATVVLNAGGADAGDAEGFNVEFTTGDATIDFVMSATSTLTGAGGAVTGTTTRIGLGEAANTYAAAYTACVAEDPDFYVVLPTTIDETLMEAVALLVEQHARQVWVQTDDKTGVCGSGSADIASTLKTGAYKNTVCLLSSDTSSNWSNAALAGATMPDGLYGINPCYYPLTSVTADSFTATEITNLVSKRCNRLESIGGYTVMPGVSLVATEGGNYGGITSSGQFIDLVAVKHYLEQKVSEAVYNLLFTQPKIPFTLEGFAQIESVIRAAVYNYGVATRIIEEGSVTITMPDLATYDATKKSQRWLDGVDGSGTLQGAINKISVTFNLAV